MTRSDLLSLVVAVVTDGVAAHNEAVALAFGYRFVRGEPHHGWIAPDGASVFPPDFSNLAVAAKHTPDGWIPAVSQWWDGSWGSQLISRRRKDTHVNGKHFSDEASARVAASLRALAEDADA